MIVYSLWVNNDLIEGRGPLKMVGLFTTLEVAQQVGELDRYKIGGVEICYKIRPHTLYTHFSVFMTDFHSDNVPLCISYRS